MAIFGHSEFLLVFFRKNCWKKFGMAIFGHSQFLPFFWEKLWEKIWNSHFWPFPISTSLFGKNCGNLEWPVLAITNFYQSFWGKVSEKIWNGHFSYNFSVHATLMCNGLESNEICTIFWIFKNSLKKYC